MQKHVHEEAYMIMEYECCSCGVEELIWNSRDGVTSFTIRCRHCDNGLARHIYWLGDVYNPHYKPRPGERIFVDLTKEKAEDLAVKRVAAVNAQYHDLTVQTGEELRARCLEVAIGLYGNGHQPYLLTVEG